MKLNISEIKEKKTNSRKYSNDWIRAVSLLPWSDSATSYTMLVFFPYQIYSCHG